jgi:hypothetical protein
MGSQTNRIHSTARPRTRRRRRSARGSALFLFPSLTLVIAGLVLDFAAVRAGMIFVALGILAFVVGAWLLVHPEEGGEVGRPDMTPWGVG